MANVESLACLPDAQFFSFTVSLAISVRRDGLTTFLQAPPAQPPRAIEHQHTATFLRGLTMYIAEIVLYKEKEIIYNNRYKERTIRLSISSFISSLQNSGQIVDSGDIVETEKNYKILVNIYEKDSIDEKYNSIHVDYAENVLKKKNIIFNKYNIIGKSVGGNDPCKCKEYPYFILYINTSFIDSPIRCGKCFLPVPLYKIYKDKKRSFGYLSLWEDNYSRFYYLYMYNENYKKFAYNQLSKYNSSINSDGIYHCDNIFDITKIKTYYYLDYYDSLKILELCPKCKKKWKLNEKIHEIFNFKCENCFFIA